MFYTYKSIYEAVQKSKDRQDFINETHKHVIVDLIESFNANYDRVKLMTLEQAKYAIGTKYFYVYQHLSEVSRNLFFGIINCEHLSSLSDNDARIFLANKYFELDSNIYCSPSLWTPLQIQQQLNSTQTTSREANYWLNVKYATLYSHITEKWIFNSKSDETIIAQFRKFTETELESCVFKAPLKRSKTPQRLSELYQQQNSDSLRSDSNWTLSTIHILLAMSDNNLAVHEIRHAENIEVLAEGSVDQNQLPQFDQIERAISAEPPMDPRPSMPNHPSFRR